MRSSFRRYAWTPLKFGLAAVVLLTLLSLIVSRAPDHAVVNFWLFMFYMLAIVAVVWIARATVGVLRNRANG